MVLLAVSIVIALLITIGLPIVVGFWLKRKIKVTWRVILYGSLAYFITQALVTIIYSGFAALVENDILTFSDQAFLMWQIILSVLLTAIIGVLVRWAGMKFIREDLNTLKSAYGIGLGYGSIETLLLVGLPLLTTFITMVSNINIDPQTTKLDPEVITQIEQLWQVQPYIPLVGALERITAIVMHLTVTILILQVFKKNQFIWLAAAFGVDLIVNGLVVGLSELGVGYGWIIFVALVLMIGNVYLLYRLEPLQLITNKGNK